MKITDFFREDNTEGFAADERAMLNRITANIMADFDGDETNATDAVSNAFYPGAAEWKIEKQARKALGLL